jgi:membrane carboxypeptidase/penicillin-binding protein
LGTITLLVILPSGVAFGGAAALYWSAVAGLPHPQETIYLDPIIGPTELYDRTSQTLIYSVEDPLGDEREWVSLADLPPYIAQATLIVEDPDFMTATRFDAFQAFSKLWRNVLSGPLPPDPSLTGRLVRNTLLPSQDSTRETALVAEINRRYSPEQILEWHLNTNYYGHEAYGIEAAARVYLGKRASDLTLDEAALLAAIPTAPQYNPLDNETAARGRQADVLRAMQVAGYITPDQFGEAAGTLTPIQSGLNLPTQIAPDFALYARRQAEDILNNLGYDDGAQMVARSGLRITTTLDLDLYYQSECALRIHLARLGGDTADQPALDGGACTSAALLPTSASAVASPPDSGILVVLDVNTGEIKSMVGPASATNFKPDPNTTIGYQPGPTLQPFVYFEGFRNALPRYTAASMVMDIPSPFPGPAEGLIYTPTNPDGQFRGPMNLRDAMGAGLLPPAVSVTHNQGIDSILLIAHRIGLNSLDENARYDLSLLERGGAVSVLDISYAYSVFASLGEMRGVYAQSLARGYRQRNPVAVLRIEDSSGNTLWQYDDAQIAASIVSIFPAELGYLVNDILADQETRWPVLGQNNVLDLPRPAAVVNGLTGDDRDAWAVGYTPHLVTGVHLGRSDGQQMTLDAFGLQGAAPIWRAVMEYAHNRDGLPAVEWERPPGIVEMPVCERSGLLPNGACPVRSEIFIEGTQPTQIDTYWQTFEINSDTRQLATANTPVGLRTQETFFIPPPEAMDWWQAHNLPLPPAEIDTISRPELFRSVQILQPERFAYVGGVVDIRGSLDPNMQSYTISYGQGLNPTEWIQIGEQQTAFTRGSSLGAWDTTGLDGLYNLRLRVELSDNAVEYDIVPVTVDNTPPAVSLSAGEPGQLFRFPADDVIPLVADVQDNLALARVEFYHNGQLLGVDAEWPYGFEWDITRTGVETFTAVAFDAVGNQASSEITVEITRAG